MEKIIYFDNVVIIFFKFNKVYEDMDMNYRSFGVNVGRSLYKLVREVSSLISEIRKKLVVLVNYD